jgi:hypothetical protein
MRKAIIAAVAALAIAPFTASIPVAHADLCSATYAPGSIGYNNCEAIANGQYPPPSGPDPCAYNLQPPNPSPGAYQGCETARQATGG